VNYLIGAQRVLFVKVATNLSDKDIVKAQKAPRLRRFLLVVGFIS
jgi:hypothetical protein